ncbi:N4-gp56 family major capsid protein [Aliivibrio fischeri]|uniref:N4-gp56 family major capsid protein n=1 Tax=Aliivibrio fischeri TaxID=668 RepID=UPI001F1851DC|nr:N4-gp56 family major capsid protein [Aliivibrio fischeri]MCE7567542.1 N4-gp56 family major capsid protein [Aliivibrio fischeri]
MTAITKAQAAKAFGAALFTHTRRQNTFVNMLTGSAPKNVPADKNRNKTQTESGAPVVMINDLSKQAGDTVEMDLFHNLNKKPTMGDKKIEGRGEDLNKVEFELSINQGRHNVDSGGRMSQQRTKQNLLQVARTMLGNYFNDLQDEIATYHLAGARGSWMPDDLIVPTADDPDFNEIVVNKITPPTYDRHFYGGDADSLTAIDSTDTMTLAKIDELALFLEEMAHPIKPIKFEADQLAGESPFYVLFVTPRQWSDLWNDIQTKSSTKESAASLIANAVNRSQGFKHPLFQGDRIMWRNILVRKYSKPVRFTTGDKVNVSTNTKLAVTTDIEITAKVTIDRAILLGGQALANAYGKTTSGAQFKMTTKKVDHDNGRETSIAWMNGLAKVRFKEQSGRLNDYGVAVVDTAVTM